MALMNYLRETKAELRHVTWPTKSQTINYTIIVLAISIGTGLFLGILDYLLAQGIEHII